jgi:hypothetical protein
LYITHITSLQNATHFPSLEKCTSDQSHSSLTFQQISNLSCPILFSLSETYCRAYPAPDSRV